MIAGLKPYSAYKDSGQQWLGQVPEHWPVLPHRALFEEIKEKDHAHEQMLSVTITQGVIKQKELLAGSSKKDSSKLDKSAYKLVCPGDIAYNKMRAWQGALGVSDYRGIISPAYVVQRPRTASNSRYFHHLLRTPGFAKEAESWSYGITSDMWSLRPEHFKAIYSPRPPDDEQAAIVRFLDHALAKIDKTIRAKRKAIALLGEQKQAIIHRAVTRGLYPDASLKESGIPWLGQIPAHWEVKRLGLMIRLLTGFPFASQNFSARETDVKLLRGINVTPTGIRWESTVRWSRSPEDGLDEFSLLPGDIVLGMDRPIVSSGVRASVIRETDVPSLLLQRVARLRIKAGLNKEFLLALLRGRVFSDYMTPIFTGISVPHLSPEQIKSFKIMLPPVDEQEKIITAIETEAAALSNAQSKLEREVTLLREYRTRLIADVVTGKLDVREAAAKLPASSSPDAIREAALAEEPGLHPGYEEADDDELVEDAT